MKTDVLHDRNVAIIGKTGGVTRNEAADLIQQHGGFMQDRPNAETDLLVIGIYCTPKSAFQSLSSVVRAQIASGVIETTDEIEFLQSLGIGDSLDNRQLFTSAELAEILGLAADDVKRWHRLQLLTPAKEVHRLAYFDFHQLMIAKRIASWVDQGLKATELQKQLDRFRKWSPEESLDATSPSLTIESGQLVWVSDDVRAESAGQLRFDFGEQDAPRSLSLVTVTDRRSIKAHTPYEAGALERQSIDLNSREEHLHESTSEQPPATIKFPSREDHELSEQDLFAEVMELEESGQFHEAIEWCRVALARFGADPDVNFQLAELLYRVDDKTAARERYYAAIEIDEDFVEARANLGCVLAELGQIELAKSAFIGALGRHDDYADVHYHIARLYDSTNEPMKAVHHWQRFLELASNSPWADEARHRLQSENES